MSYKTKKSDTTPEMYFHVPLNHAQVHYATVFYRMYEGTWLYAVALCANGDTFSRKRGRTLARRRWFENDGWGHLTGRGDLSTGEIMSGGVASKAQPTFAMAERAARYAARNMTPRA